MTRFNPFPRVSCAAGAPMGRQGDDAGTYEDGLGRLYARHQGGSDGYDSGGAYWGYPSDVYVVWTRGGAWCTYARASRERDAIARVRGYDGRHTITREYCGYRTRRWAVRFCGEWIEGGYLRRRNAVGFAQEHYAARLAAMKGN